MKDKKEEECACGDNDIPNATHTKYKCETPRMYSAPQTDWEEEYSEILRTMSYPENAVKSFIKELLKKEREEWIEKIEGKKRILWHKDTAQHIRNIQNNETIDDIINLLKEE